MIDKKNSSIVLVFNDKQELLLQLRSKHDSSFPLHWDFSVGGAMEPQENHKDAAERELKEELGIISSLEFVTTRHFKYQAWDPNVTREGDSFIYKTTSNGPFMPDPKEIDEVKFASLSRIQEMIDLRIKFHPEFLLAWNEGLIQKAFEE